MAILRGLNVANSLIDVDRFDQSLANLGLRIADLDLIRNVRRTEELGVADFHQISGLVDNQDRLFYSQLESARTAKGQIQTFKEVDATQNYNLAINDRVIAGAIKYDYIDYNNPELVPIKDITGVTAGTNTVTGTGLLTNVVNGKTYTLVAGDQVRVVDTGSDLTDGDYTVTGTPSETSFVLTGLNAGSNVTDFTNITMLHLKKWPIKSADISTSRVSSWSPIGDPNPDSYITYGAKLEVSGEYLSLTQLGVTSEPVVKEFRGEIPTHTIRLNVNGANVDFPVMKGIPLSWEFSGTRNYNAQFATTGNLPILEDNLGKVPFSIKRQDITLNTPAYKFDAAVIAANRLSYVSESGLNSASTHTFNVYYPPSRISEIRFSGLYTKEFPFTKMENLSRVLLNNGKFKVIPDFKFIAPSLLELQMVNNDLMNGWQYLEELGLGSLEALYPSTEGNVNDTLNQIVAQAQINRLPPSLEKVDLRNSFQGNISIDYSHLVNIQNFQIGATNSERGTPRITSIGSSPIGPDPSYMVTFNPAIGSVYSVNSTTATFTIANHRFADNDYVRYQYHAYDDGTGITAMVFTGEMGSNLSGLADGTIYQVHSVSGDSFQLRNTNGSAITSGAYTASNGLLHSLHKWAGPNVADDIFIDPVYKGIKEEKIHYAAYNYLSRHMCNSEELTRWDHYSVPLKAINKTPYVAGTMANNVSSADRLKSNADRSVYCRSKKLTYFRSAYTDHNTVDISNNPNLSTFWLNHFEPDPYYSLADRTWTSDKIAGHSAMSYLFVRYCGQYSLNGNRSVRGNFSGYMAAKPNLRILRIYYNTGIKFTPDDNTFSGNNQRMYYYQYYGPRGSTRYDHGVGYNALGDFWGIDGRPNRTGKHFDDIKNSLQYLYMYGHHITSTRWVNDNPENSEVYSIPLESCTNLRQIYSISVNGTGPFPSLSGKTRLQKAFLYSNKNKLSSPQAANVGAIYRINRIMTTSSMFNMNYYGDFYHKEFEDFGWSAGDRDQIHVDFSTSSAYGTTPQNNQYLRYKESNIDNITPGIWCLISDTGSGTAGQIKARWQNVGWVANTPYPTNFSGYQGTENQTGSNPKVGDIFLPAESRSNLNRVHLKHLTNGQSYRVVRTGPSNAPWSSRGGARSYGNEFNATSSSSYSTSYGAIAERQSYYDLGGGAGNSSNDTGARFRRVSYASQNALFNLGYTGSINALNSMQTLTEYRIQRNSFSGSFPKPVAGNLRYFDISSNNFSGNIPDFSTAIKVLDINCSNNDFDGYTPFSLGFCNETNKINFQSNKLPASVAGDLIADLYTTALVDSPTPRRNVAVYLKGQRGFATNGAGKYLDGNGLAVRLSVRALDDIPGDTDDPSHPKKKYQVLTSTYGWTIDMDEI